ncbi:MAG: Gfo/Idh/MocA family oxidoreductase [Erysipelotrichaceae bacterium]|nr:Gfo/Idh/MocA family oxidoreductase [Erysipelotrichaceae bacterium]
MKPQTPGSPLRFAMIGCSSIAHRMAAAMEHHPYIEMKAAFSRNISKAQDFAKTWNIEKAVSSLDDLLNDPDIDAFYIAVPHKFHTPIALEALDHKKAVLCEKPAVIHPDEMEEIMQTAHNNSTLFMEAMKTRFVPGYAKIRQMIENKELGDIERISVSLCSDFGELLNDPLRYYNQPDQGGCLFDGGCYELNYFLDFLPGPCRIVQMEAEAVSGAERYVYCLLDFDGKDGILENSINRAKPKTAVIEGTLGTMLVYDLHRPVRFDVKWDDKASSFEVPYDFSDMYSQLDSFYETWKEGAAENRIMPHSESLRQSRLLHQLRKRALETAQQNQ